MKNALIACVLALSLAGFAAAQTSTSTTTTTDNDRAGKQTVTSTETTVTRPTKITPAIVRSVQQELDRRGYQVGRPDGVYGRRTRAAVRKFQADQNLRATGYLDNNTLAKLNVGGTNMISSAPGDIGRGGKAFGHDVKQGHPVEGAKALGKGAEGFGKGVAKGSEALGKKGVEKVGHGLSSVGNKVEGTVQGGNHEANPPKDNPPKR